LIRAALLGLLAMATLSGCIEDVVPYQQGPNTVIATNHDGGQDNNALTDGHAAIAYDPDGCQGWIMDDGVEGYSGRRYDPKTGLPVCNGLYPPGTVVGDYRAHNRTFGDWVPAHP
jgi:hypothetical protein